MELRRAEGEYSRVAIVLPGDDRFRRIDAAPAPAGARFDELSAHVEFQLRTAEIGGGTRFAVALARGADDTAEALWWARSFEHGQWVRYMAQDDGALVPTLLSLARGIDAKNRFTGGHPERVAGYAVALAESLGFEP